jgi:beta-glucosidase
MSTTFPPDFVFGVATSSYQIEGAAARRGAAIWDVFARTPGAIAGGATADRACDHYHRYGEDVALMRDLGIDAYRFSVAWPRVLPEGRGTIDSDGLDFYDRLVDELLEAGIAPWICLHHWDLPQALQDRGGWSNRDLAAWFTDYAATVIDRLGDRAAAIAMLNEPSVVVVFGHLLGVHAPGLEESPFRPKPSRAERLERALAAYHHMNLATATAVDALRSLRSGLELGTILAWNRIEPWGDRDEDLEAARRVEALLNEAALQPLLGRGYPDEIDHLLEPVVLDDDFARLERPLDFLGLSYSTRLRVRSAPGARLLDAWLEDPPEGTLTSAMGWEIHAEGLLRELLALDQRFELPPLYVTANGVATEDELDLRGEVHDGKRIDYLAAHLEACAVARDRGVDLRGYFVRSLLDGFEWTEGYDRRFGLVHVDFDTLERTPKDSFHWYAEVVRQRRLP